MDYLLSLHFLGNLRLNSSYGILTSWLSYAIGALRAKEHKQMLILLQVGNVKIQIQSKVVVWSNSLVDIGCLIPNPWNNLSTIIVLYLVHTLH